jgi:hypothetical protein
MQKKHKHHNLKPVDFTPSPTTPTNTPNNEGILPSNSLLFSPNPETHPLIPDNVLMQSIQLSCYQTTPSLGTWGNAP